MSQPVVAQKEPYVVEEAAGKKMWCGCGLSKRQPYCDSSHGDSAFGP